MPKERVVIARGRPSVRTNVPLQPDAPLPEKPPAQNRRARRAAEARARKAST